MWGDNTDKNVELRINKPCFHPPIKRNESPTGYLFRLVKENQYSNISWLLNKQSCANSHLNKNILSDLKRQKWIGLEKVDFEKIREMTELPTTHLNRHLRYCPLCLKKDGYWQLNWHLQASVACIKHRIWLVDECPSCETLLSLNKVSLDRCGACTQELDIRQDIKACPSQVVVMQRFLEGKSFDSYSDVPLLSKHANDMTLKQRSEALLVFSRAQSRPKLEIKQVYKRLTQMRTAKSNMMEVAIGLFGGYAGFWTFLLEVHSRGYEGKVTGQSSIQKFYRLFYEKCGLPFFEPYKSLLEEFINRHIFTELTRRNSLFKTETITNHPWISLEHASRDYRISKSAIRRAITDRLFDAKVETVNNRTRVLLNKPDLELKMFRLDDVINGTEAAAILGVTKKQFKQLRDTDTFQHAISPKEGYCSTWQFSRQEIERYAQSILKKVPVIKADYMCIPEIMRTYGRSFENLFLMLIEAIESGELDAKTFNAKQGIRSLSIKKTEVVEWVESKLGEVDFFSVPQVAKLLVIQQQFAYELVHLGLMQCELDEATGARCIKEEHLAAFEAKYILLSKLSKSIELSSRTLIGFLSSKAIYPIDKGWSRKLRQKVYLREHVSSIHWLERRLTL